MRDPFAASADGGAAAGRVGTRPRRPEPELTLEQADAFRRLEDAAAAQTFRTVLLHGVTGSGKTELYLRLARQVIARGRRVLILVPEIGLTPSVVGQFRARFGDRVAIQHSGLVGRRAARPVAPHPPRRRGRRRRHAVRRVRAARAARRSSSSTRSTTRRTSRTKRRAITAATWPSCGRGWTARWSCSAAATPSLESASNARSGRYDHVTLTRRVLDRPLAAVRIVNMRDEYAALGADVALSRPLVDGDRRSAGRGEQTVVLLNRRGFATVVFCRQCGSSLECPHCSVSLTFHRTQRRVRCHYCNYAAPVPQRCGACGGEYLEQTGFGTERLEADVRAQFPGARVARVDRDTIRRRGAIARVLQAVARGDIDILVGTQMIAKGHDFPGGHAGRRRVGGRRAGPRGFPRRRAHVPAADAGRRAAPAAATCRGEAIIQTLYPDHYAIQSAAAQDYDTFYRARNGIPREPAVSAGRRDDQRRREGTTRDGAMTDAHDLVKRTRHHHPHGQVIGPAPAALAKINDEYRAQFFIKGQQRKPMREALLARSTKSRLKRA